MVAVAETYLTVEEVAHRLRIDAGTVRRWLRGGQLRGVSLGRKSGWRIPESEFARFLEERTR